jgi:hypothetical protein
MSFNGAVQHPAGVVDHPSRTAGVAWHLSYFLPLRLNHPADWVG